MCLAIGLGLMKILQPRKLWVLTHGVPMLSVSPEVFNDIHDNPEFFKIERP